MLLGANDLLQRADFNAQLAGWLEVVNRRRRRALGCAPIDRIAADRAAMLALPPVGPVTGWRASTRLARDHYIRLDGNDYSVHPAVIGRRVELVADLSRVRVFCEGGLVADHDRPWARHQTITDPEHLAAAKALRRERIGLVRPAPEPEVQIRALTDYDTALGVHDHPQQLPDLDDHDRQRVDRGELTDDGRPA